MDANLSGAKLTGAKIAGHSVSQAIQISQTQLGEYVTFEGLHNFVQFYCSKLKVCQL